MRDLLRDCLDGGLSRRGFFEGLMAAGFTAAATGSLLKAADQGGTEAAEIAAKRHMQVGSSGQLADPVYHPGDHTVITQVRLRGRPGLWNVGIQDGRIGRISQEPIPGSDVIFGDGMLLTEGLVEHHIHLDKTLTADRLSWDEERLNADRQKFEQERTAGRFIRTFTIFRESLIKTTFTEDDVFDRAVRMAKIQSANGITAVRTHCVVEAVRDLKCLRGLLRARDAIRAYMDLQISLHPQDGNLLREPATIDLVHRGMELGADGVGGVPEVDPDHADDYIDLVFRLAKEHGGFVDIHVDQARDLRMFSPPIMVAKTRKYGLQGKVTASHAHSLGFQPRERVLPVLEEMREVGMHLACAPNQYLQERVQIPRSKGLLVSLICDNVRDPLQRGGKADPVEQAASYSHQMGVNSNEGLESVFDLITTCTGQAIGLKDYGLHEGGRADLVLFDADSAPHVLCYQAGRALVFKNGKVVAQAGRCLWGYAPHPA